MATMTWQDLIALQNAHPGASREQLAAIWQQQQAAGSPPPPGRPDVRGSMVLDPPAANYAPGATGGGPNPPPPPTPSPTTGGGGSGTPSVPLNQAIANYQATHPYSPTAFQDLVKTLQSQGY